MYMSKVQLLAKAKKNDDMLCVCALHIVSLL